MSTYSVRGFSANTGTTYPAPICAVWNPDATESVKVVECGVFMAGLRTGTTQNSPVLYRTTAQGTAGSTVTPDADNAWDDLVAPASGLVLDLALFSVAPTTASPPLWAMQCGGNTATGSAGLGFQWASSRGILVPPGTGLMIGATMNGVNLWPASECYFVWEEA